MLCWAFSMFHRCPKDTVRRWRDPQTWIRHLSSCLLKESNASFIPQVCFFPELKFVSRYGRRYLLNSILKGYWHKRNAPCPSQSHWVEYFPTVCTVSLFCWLRIAFSTQGTVLTNHYRAVCAPLVRWLPWFGEPQSFQSCSLQGERRPLWSYPPHPVFVFFFL